MIPLMLNLLHYLIIISIFNIHMLAFSYTIHIYLNTLVMFSFDFAVPNKMLKYTFKRINSYDGSLYYMNLDGGPYTRYEAETACNTWFNTHLTSILTVEEFNFIV